MCRIIFRQIFDGRQFKRVAVAILTTPQISTIAIFRKNQILCSCIRITFGMEDQVTAEYKTEFAYGLATEEDTLQSVIDIFANADRLEREVKECLENSADHLQYFKNHILKNESLMQSCHAAN